MIEKKTINYALRPSIRCLVENREMKEDIERMESESDDQVCTTRGCIVKHINSFSGFFD